MHTTGYHDTISRDGKLKNRSWTIPFHAYNESKLDDFSHLETPKNKYKDTESHKELKQGSN